MDLAGQFCRSGILEGSYQRCCKGLSGRCFGGLTVDEDVDCHHLEVSAVECDDVVKWELIFVDCCDVEPAVEVDIVCNEDC